MNPTCCFLAAAASAVLLSSPAGSQPATQEIHKSGCFYSGQFENWKAPDARTIYIRVGVDRYYRLDLVAPCERLAWPGAFLITRLRGSNSICTAMDWDLHVATSWHDIPTACIVKTMTELSPDEAAKLPKSSRP